MFRRRRLQRIYGGTNEIMKGRFLARDSSVCRGDATLARVSRITSQIFTQTALPMRVE